MGFQERETSFGTTSIHEIKQSQYFMCRERSLVISTQTPPRKDSSMSLSWILESGREGKRMRDKASFFQCIMFQYFFVVLSFRLSQWKPRTDSWPTLMQRALKHKAPDIKRTVKGNCWRNPCGFRRCWKWQCEVWLCRAIFATILCHALEWWRQKKVLKSSFDFVTARGKEKQTDSGDNKQGT